MVQKKDILRGTPTERSKPGSQQDQDIYLLLTDLEMRRVLPHEAQELKNIVHKTLNISAQIEEVSVAELDERPVLLHFRKGNSLKDTYRLLYSLLESSNPTPQRRLRSFHQSLQQPPFMEALRRGIETGEDVLTFQHADEVRMEPSNWDLSSQRRITQELRLSTYQRLDSLEETIQELENTVIEISGHSMTEGLYTETEVALMSIPAQRTGSLKSETKRPPVPPKPASIQVQYLLLLLY